MSFGNDQCMTLRYREAIVDGESVFVCQRIRLGSILQKEQLMVMFIDTDEYEGFYNKFVIQKYSPFFNTVNQQTNHTIIHINSAFIFVRF